MSGKISAIFTLFKMSAGLLMLEQYAKYFEKKITLYICSLLLHVKL